MEFKEREKHWTRFLVHNLPLAILETRRELTWDLALFSFRFVNNIPAGM